MAGHLPPMENLARKFAVNAPPNLAPPAQALPTATLPIAVPQVVRDGHQAAMVLMLGTLNVIPVRLKPALPAPVHLTVVPPTAAPRELAAGLQQAQIHMLATHNVTLVLQRPAPQATQTAPYPLADILRLNMPQNQPTGTTTATALAMLANARLPPPVNGTTLTKERQISRPNAAMATMKLAPRHAFQ